MATYLQSSPGIYKITSTTSGKIYIGCASNIKTRINVHLYDLRRKLSGKRANKTTFKYI
jgi:predicted GIY-YIG superfamily endonuclease